MDKLIGQFKLQNFLRQMFCGVVFLLPFFLFPATVQLCPCVPKFYACFPQPGDLDFAQLTALAVIASIVGTIIYHIEKNVFSYPIQMCFQQIILWLPKWKKCIFVVVFLVTLFVISIFIYIYDISWPFWVIVSSVVLVGMFTSLFALQNGIVDNTRKLWALEDREKETSGDDDKAILKRVGTWSDFIHCGQSCAIAWILGSLLCNASLGGCLSNDTVYRHGIFLAIVLLILEVFIDWHRYQHVRRILNPGTPGDQKPTPNSGKNKGNDITN